MKFGNVTVALVSAMLAATPVFAQAAPEAAPAVQVKTGSKIFSSDGKRVGIVDRVVKAKDGTPLTVGIISESKFVYVPISTLSYDGKRFVSSMTRSQIVDGK